MRVTCVIDNYNYDKYLEESIDSALNQTRPFDEIIVVDDGSTDTSQDILTRKYQNIPNLKIVIKENQGQLSSLLAGIKEASGDWICFLDADDRYKPHYLEKVEKFCIENPHCDFLFCGGERFGDAAHKFSKEIRFLSRTTDFGNLRTMSLFTTYPWIGAATVMLSGRASSLKKLAEPKYPHLSDWVTRADDYLIHGADVIGMRKCYLDEVLVDYRVHGNNAFLEISKDPMYKEERRQKLHRLFTFLIQEYIEDPNVKGLAQEYLNSKYGNQKINRCKNLSRFVNIMQYMEQDNPQQPKTKFLIKAIIIYLSYGLGFQGSIRKYL